MGPSEWDLIIVVFQCADSSAHVLDETHLALRCRRQQKWVVPFNRQYRSKGILSFNTLEDNRLVLYQKEDGVVTRKVLGRKRGS